MLNRQTGAAQTSSFCLHASVLSTLLEVYRTMPLHVVSRYTSEDAGDAEESSHVLDGAAKEHFSFRSLDLTHRHLSLSGAFHCAQLWLLKI